MPDGWRRRYPCGRKRRCRARCPGTDGGDRCRGGRTRTPGDPGGTVFPRFRYFCSATPVVGRKAARIGIRGRPRCECVHRGPWPGDPGGTIFPRCRYFRSATPVACAGGKVYAGLQGAGGMQDALAGGAGSLFFALVPSGYGRPAPDKALGGEVASFMRSQARLMSLNGYFSVNGQLLSRRGHPVISAARRCMSSVNFL